MADRLGFALSTALLTLVLVISLGSPQPGSAGGGAPTASGTPVPTVTRTPLPSGTPPAPGTLVRTADSPTGRGFILQVRAAAPFTLAPTRGFWSPLAGPTNPSASLSALAGGPTGFLGVGFDLTSGAVSVIPNDGTLIPPSGDAFVDLLTPINGGLKCYTVLVLHGTPPGAEPSENSDLLCAWKGFATAPTTFNLRLNEGTMAELFWNPQANPDGATLLVLPSGERIDVPPDGSLVRHDTRGQVTCYILVLPVGNTDAVCPIPGASHFGESGSGALGTQIGELASQVRAAANP